MQESDNAVPTERSEPLPAPTATSAANRSAARGNLVVIGALLVLVLFLIAFGVYWVQTADMRLERQATDALRVLADLQERMVFSSEPEIVELNNGQFAKVRYQTFPSLVHMTPTESSSYPFEAAITTPYDRFVTISHPSRDTARADERYYRLPDDQFYDDPQAAAHVQRQSFYQTSKLEVSLLWDAKLSKWLENSRGSPPPDGTGESFAPGTDE